MMKKMIFLFNPRSGKEAIKNQLSDILGIFCRAGYLPSVYVTQEPGDAAKIAEEYVSRIEKRAVGHMREAFYEPAGNTL